MKPENLFQRSAQTPRFSLHSGNIFSPAFLLKCTFLQHLLLSDKMTMEPTVLTDDVVCKDLFAFFGSKVNPDNPCGKRLTFYCRGKENVPVGISDIASGSQIPIKGRIESACSCFMFLTRSTVFASLNSSKS